jgi:glycosyltransferase involved in cell wall biosynthesis
MTPKVIAFMPVYNEEAQIGPLLDRFRQVLEKGIVHEVTGLVVPPDDESALRAAIRRLLEDRALAARLGAAAQQRAREQYSVAAMTRRYEELWRRLAA